MTTLTDSCWHRVSVSALVLTLLDGGARPTTSLRSFVRTRCERTDMQSSTVCPLTEIRTRGMTDLRCCRWTVYHHVLVSKLLRFHRKQGRIRKSFPLFTAASS